MRIEQISPINGRTTVLHFDDLIKLEEWIRNSCPVLMHNFYELSIDQLKVRKPALNSH